MKFSPDARKEALARVERVTAWPLLILAVAIIPIIILPMVKDFSPAAQTSLTVADWLIWGIFAIEFTVRLVIAPLKRPFLAHNLIDVLVVVVPFAQPLRLLRSVRVLRLVRVGRAGTYLAESAKGGRSLFSRENFSYAMAVTLIALGGGALLVWGIEKHAPQANIKSFPDAIWWSITTVSTVGGEKYPVTSEGRAVAVVLMVLGIGLVGLIAATLSSLFVEQEHNGEFTKLLEKIEGLERRLDGLVKPGEPPVQDNGQRSSASAGKSSSS